VCACSAARWSDTSLYSDQPRHCEVVCRHTAQHSHSLSHTHTHTHTHMHTDLNFIISTGDIQSKTDPNPSPNPTYDAGIPEHTRLTLHEPRNKAVCKPADCTDVSPVCRWISSLTLPVDTELIQTSLTDVSNWPSFSRVDFFILRNKLHNATRTARIGAMFVYLNFLYGLSLQMVIRPESLYSAEPARCRRIPSQPHTVTAQYFVLLNSVGLYNKSTANRTNGVWA